MADLPPLHHHLERPTPSQSINMDHRLPSIASLVSLDQHPSDPLFLPLPWAANDGPSTSTSTRARASAIASASVSTNSPSPAPPSQLANMWTAINHINPPSTSRPTPAARYVFPAAPNTRRLSSPERGRNAQSTFDQHMSSSTPSPHSQSPTLTSQPSSPPRQLRPESAASPKPIMSRRQDSAVSESPVSLASTAAQEPASSSSVRPESNSPEPSFRVRHAAAVSIPRTPLLPASSTLSASAPSIYSTRHDRRRASPPETVGYDMKVPTTPIRPRALSDSNVSPSSQPITSTHSQAPAQSNAVETTVRGSMAPPPNPTPAASAAQSSSPALSDGQPLTARSAAVPAHQTPASESDSQNITCVSTPVLDESADTSTSAQSPVPELAVIMTVPHQDSDSSTRCLSCGAEWTYPPMDTGRFARPRTPEATQELSTPTLEVLNNMSTSTLELLNHMHKYGNNRAQAYQNWERQHQTKPGQPDASVPCMFARDEVPEGTSMSNKRKSNLDDGYIYTKLRRLSCNSPALNSEHTPPPEQPLSSSPPDHPINHDGAYLADHSA